MQDNLRPNGVIANADLLKIFVKIYVTQESDQNKL